MNYAEVFKYSRPLSYRVYPSEPETDVANELRPYIACAVDAAKRKSYDSMIAFEGRLWSVNITLQRMEKYTGVSPLANEEYNRICNLLYKIYKKS